MGLGRALRGFIRDQPHRRLQPFRHLHDCSGCFRLERSPGGTCTHWKAPPSHGARKMRTFRDGGAMYQIDHRSLGAKASGFETRKLAAILAVDIVGFSRLRLTAADEDHTLASQPRATRGAGRLAMTPWLVRTNQSPPRFSIRKTRPAPGIESPGATSCGPSRLSTTAMPSRTVSTL
jgi:hypothetical protein